MEKEDVKSELTGRGSDTVAAGRGGGEGGGKGLDENGVEAIKKFIFFGLFFKKFGSIFGIY